MARPPPPGPPPPWLRKLTCASAILASCGVSSRSNSKLGFDAVVLEHDVDEAGRGEDPLEHGFDIRMLLDDVRGAGRDLARLGKGRARRHADAHAAVVDVLLRLEGHRQRARTGTPVRTRMPKPTPTMPSRWSRSRARIRATKTGCHSANSPPFIAQRRMPSSLPARKPAPAPATSATKQADACPAGRSRRVRPCAAIIAATNDDEHRDDQHGLDQIIELAPWRVGRRVEQRLHLAGRQRPLEEREIAHPSTCPRRAARAPRPSGNRPPSAA